MMFPIIKLIVSCYIPFLVLADPADSVSDSAEKLTIQFSEPIDVANKLLYDLDQIVQAAIQNRTGGLQPTQPTLLFNHEDNPLVSGVNFSSKNAEPGKDNSVGQLVGNLIELDRKLQSTFHDLQNRRRFVLGAMVRQMQYTVRRIRTGVTRMQAQLTSAETVATQMPLIRPLVHSVNGTLQPLPPGAPDPSIQHIHANKELVQEIEDRIQEVSKKINDIVVRLSAGLNTPPSNPDGNVNPIRTLNTIIQNHARPGINPKKPQMLQTEEN